MNKTKIEAVFFDCWDTLISFCCKNKNWNVISLYEHARNKKQLDLEKLYQFSDSFFKDYYNSHSMYEIDMKAILSLMVKYFGIDLDCPIETCTHEILCYLSPKPIKGIDSFLTFLDEKSIPYYVLSNTIYPSEDTLNLIEKLIPNHHFQSFLGSNEVGVKKPNPLFFKTGLKLAGVNSKKAMYIGDAFFQDVYGSNNAGFGLSIWLNHKRKKKELYHDLIDEKQISYFEVYSYSQLIKYLKENETL